MDALWAFGFRAVWLHARAFEARHRLPRPLGRRDRAAATSSPATRVTITVGGPGSHHEDQPGGRLLNITSREGNSRVSIAWSLIDPSMLIATVDGVAYEFHSSDVFGIRFEADGGDTFENRTSLYTTAYLYGENNKFSAGHGVNLLFDYSGTADVTLYDPTRPGGLRRLNLGSLILYLF